MESFGIFSVLWKGTSCNSDCHRGAGNILSVYIYDLQVQRQKKPKPHKNSQNLLG